MGFLDFLRGMSSGSNQIQQPRRDRVNVVARYMLLLDGDFYVMILDFVNDKTLIERIKSKRISLPALKKEFQGRGTKIEGGRITEYMSKLLPSLNQEDFILDVEDGDPYEVQFGFVFS